MLSVDFKHVSNIRKRRFRAIQCNPLDISVSVGYTFDVFKINVTVCK